MATDQEVTQPCPQTQMQAVRIVLMAASAFVRQKRGSQGYADSTALEVAVADLERITMDLALAEFERATQSAAKQGGAQ